MFWGNVLLFHYCKKFYMSACCCVWLNKLSFLNKPVSFPVFLPDIKSRKYESLYSSFHRISTNWILTIIHIVHEQRTLTSTFLAHPCTGSNTCSPLRGALFSGYELHPRRYVFISRCQTFFIYSTLETLNKKNRCDQVHTPFHCVTRTAEV